MSETQSSYEVVPHEEIHDKILSLAISQGAPLEQLEKWMQLKKDYEADEARKAFYDALADFNNGKPVLSKDGFNKRFGSKYTTLGNLLATYSPRLGEYGLSLSFPTPTTENGIMTVFCKLTHRLGHSDTVAIPGPIDKAAIGKESGQASRNGIQDIRSTFTYLRSMAVEAVLGVAGTKGTFDDDGNSGVKPTEMATEAQIKEINTKYKEAGGPADKMGGYLTRLYKVDTPEALTQKQAENYIASLNLKLKAAKK